MTSASLRWPLAVAVAQRRAHSHAHAREGGTIEAADFFGGGGRRVVTCRSTLAHRMQPLSAHLLSRQRQQQQQRQQREHSSLPGGYWSGQRHSLSLQTRTHAAATPQQLRPAVTAAAHTNRQPQETEADRQQQRGQQQRQRQQLSPSQSLHRGFVDEDIIIISSSSSSCGTMIQGGGGAGCSSSSSHSDPTQQLPSDSVSAEEPLEPQVQSWERAVRTVAFAAVLAVGLALSSPTAPSALAADALATCTCLLQNCRGELARCLGDVNCAANIACLQSCNGRADETECQIGCGDLFANKVVDEFNACAISKNPCVPRKPDENLYPIPPDETLVPAFELERIRGPWYIAAGQNPTFDTFDCQLHTFAPTGPASFTAELTWRIRTPDGGFFTRSAVQDFVQQLPDRPGLLLNHDNEFLHYQDDWYIISSKLEGSPDDYFYVYYRGSNDAWDGYGGAVVYTRSRTLPPSIIPELRRASAAVGLDFDRFVLTDNSCPPPKPLLARLEEVVVEEVTAVERTVLEVAREELQLLGQLGKGLEELKKDEEGFVKRLARDDKKLLEQMESLEMGEPGDLEDLFSNPIPLRRFR